MLCRFCSPFTNTYEEAIAFWTAGHLCTITPAHQRGRVGVDMETVSVSAGQKPPRGRSHNRRPGKSLRPTWPAGRVTAAVRLRRRRERARGHAALRRALLRCARRTGGVEARRLLGDVPDPGGILRRRIPVKVPPPAGTQTVARLRARARKQLVEACVDRRAVGERRRLRGGRGGRRLGRAELRQQAARDALTLHHGAGHRGFGGGGVGWLQRGVRGVVGCGGLRRGRQVRRGGGGRAWQRGQRWVTFGSAGWLLSGLVAAR